MYFLRALFVSSCLFASTLAQDYARVAFTSVPGIAVAGGTYNITWAGGTGAPVDLILRQGNPNNLATIAIIASRVTGYSYAWTVSTSLESATNYALQITQGQSDINYSGQFSIVGGTGTLSISAPGITLPPTASGNASSLANATVVTISGSVVTLNNTGNAASTPLTNVSSAAVTSMTNSTSSSSSIMMSSNSSTAAVVASTSATRTSSSVSSRASSAASSASTAAGSGQTNFPTSTNGPGLSNLPQVGSSIAFIMAVIGAVMGLN